MKNINPPPALIKVIILIVSLTLLTITVFGNPRVWPDAVGMKTKLSGSGLRPAATFTANYTFGRCQMEFGAGIQPKDVRVSRIESSFYYALTGTKQDKSHLVLFSNIDYNFGTQLRPKTAACMARVNKESATDFCQLRSSTLEYQGGFGMYLDPVKSLHIFTGIGFGMYHTIGTPELTTSVFRERSACTLMLSAGIFYSFGPKHFSAR